MNFFYFLERYFDKLNDNKFQLIWKRHFHDRLSRTISTLFFVWTVIVVGVGILFIKATGVFFGILLTIFFSGYFAYTIIFQFLRFLAKNNTRFVQGEMFSNKNTMNYDDVVETIKK